MAGKYWPTVTPEHARYMEQVAEWNAQQATFNGRSSDMVRNTVAEQAAADHWRFARPVSAMRTLADAGYTQAQRHEWLRVTFNLDYDLSLDFSYDSYLR